MNARPPAVGLAAWRLPRTGPSALDTAVALRADGVQFDLGGPGRGEWIDAPATVEALRARSRHTGVALLGLAVNVLNDIGLTAPPGSRRALDVRRTLIRALDAAHRLGMPMVFVPSFRRSAVDGPEALRRTVTVLRWAVTEAAARGLLLASENVLDPAGAAALAEGVAHPRFRLLLDTYNPRLAGLDVPALVAAAAPHWADQIHLKDGAAGSGSAPLLGDGDGQVAATLAAVARHRLPLRALVLENDYRDGDLVRARQDVARARTLAARLVPDAAPTREHP
ncbi:sugar phosphate isomerase/epimerase family protein [Streptomyces sp. XH2]|uniref:sugar phosphate isomerase/epimerase family protein n=1 Tax=Streptomyces sp. XH2 TaxID=3412483 RepID=UPI003C7A6F4A